MTIDRSFEQRVADALVSEAPARSPDWIAEAVIAATSRRKPRRRWLILLKESPMDLDQRPAFGSRALRTARIAVLALLLAAIAFGTVVAGASLLPSPVVVTPTPSPTTSPSPTEVVPSASPPAVIPADRGVFTGTGPMFRPRRHVTATTLLDGRVLVVGGSVILGETHDSAEIWDPATGVFSDAGVMGTARDGHSATLLPDGRVLVVGGFGQTGALASAEVWDPDTMTFTPTGSLAIGRGPMYDGMAMLLADGRVLIVGGQYILNDELVRAPAEVWDPRTGMFSSGEALPEARYPTGTLLEDGRVLTVGDDGVAQVWDPETGSSSPAGSLTEARSGFSVTLLEDGRVLVAGGYGDCIPDAENAGASCTLAPVESAQIWDPATNAFAFTGPMRDERAQHAAALLHDGRVLVVGSQQWNLGKSAELFELQSSPTASSPSSSPRAVMPADHGAFSQTGPMHLSRRHPSATTLADGRVLVAGGSVGLSGDIAGAEVWDPTTGIFTLTGAMAEKRGSPVATLLQDGRVLVLGGPTGTAEIWDPATDSFSSTGSLAVGRSYGAARLLTDGRVLVWGGQDVDGGPATYAEVWDPRTGAFSPADVPAEASYPAGTPLTDGRVLVIAGDGTASVWDPSTGLSSPAGSLGGTRGDPGYDFTATRLPDGRVLVIGGMVDCVSDPPDESTCPGGAASTAEIWDPATAAFSPTGSMGDGRAVHAAALLRDGRVLVVGNASSAQGRSAEVFELK